MMFDEWHAWVVVRERERDLERRRLQREAERARKQAGQGRVSRPAQPGTTGESAGREKAA